MNAKEVARMWFEEVWNKRNEVAITELSASEVCGLSEGCSLNGPAAFKLKVFEPMVTAFPDVKVTIDGLVSEGDEVVVRWTALATHQGAFGDIPPSGRRIQFSGMTWQKIQSGKIVAVTDSYNLNGLIDLLATGKESASVRNFVG